MPLSTLPNGRQAVIVTATDGATAIVYEQGAQVASWIPAGGKEVLYVSPNSIYKDGTSIRGGVPICWPQFSDMGAGAAHGHVRKAKWDFVEDGAGTVTFRLRVKPDEPANQWNIDAELHCIVNVSSAELSVAFRIKNLAESDASFNLALHTYFAISSIGNVTLHGLDDSTWADNMRKREKFAPEEIRRIDKETDRIYLDVQGPVTISDPQNGRNIVIQGAGLPDVVLWNPWIERTKKFVDLPETGYLDFVCVEHGAIGKQVVLAKGHSWEGAQIITVQAQTSSKI
jgi:glucose-6-phosphate 1-epimerase